MQGYQFQAHKESAIASQDFDKAGQCRDVQMELRRQLAVLLDELTRND